MSEPTTFVRSRVVKGRDWRGHQVDTAAELEAQLRAEADSRGLVVDSVSDLSVQSGMNGDWARLTRTAIAHPKQV